MTDKDKDNKSTETAATPDDKAINALISDYQKYIKDKKIVHWIAMIALTIVIFTSIKGCIRNEKIADQTVKTLEALEKRLSTMDSDSVATKNNTYKILKLAEKGQR